MSEASPTTPSESCKEPRDGLTVRHLLLLTAGVAMGLALFAPRFEEGSLSDARHWRAVANAMIIGLALPAPLFCIPRSRRKPGLGTGGLFALSVGLGVWLLLPAAVIEWVARTASPASNHNAAAGCLYYVLPLMGLWYLLAAVVAGHVGRKLLSPATSWTERYGLGLALAWSPLGIWQLVDVYRDVL